MRNVILILLALLCASCDFKGSETVPTVIVEAGTFEARIPGFGELRAAKSTKIEVPATLRSRQRLAWLVDEGTPVAENDVIARLDSDQLVRRKRSAEDAVKRLEFQLNERTRTLEKESRAVQSQLDLLAREKKDSERFAPQDEALFSRHEILDAQVDLELLETKIEHAQGQLARYSQRAETEIEILRLERQTEELKLSQVRQALGSLDIRAPHAGVFFPDKNWRGEKTTVGTTLWPGSLLGELPELSQMEAKIQILESEAAGLEEGLEVTISLDAHPGRKFAGTVTTVQPVARTLTWRNPVKYFEIKVELEETDQDVMKQASQVQAAIFVMREESVFSLPNQAIFNDSEGAWVYVQEGGEFVKRVVTLGQHNLARTVIIEGLKGGERVALVPPDETDEEPG
ncbi:MAG: efflux RND transporter periplasmic adaptor subunit [Acidobacteria bacterium]|uniref:Efflux RND transporter periplasmic adaptor subunit n=1 Tax=Candidatus Polarisedimenticola svalbardensis TaxID=2886004 RepID=A0A8J7CDU8_9BACT|nr:efflux RND transporter periplasmic adaptor subunit [Candidatus Polarisedimenticola svalbardensis]